MKYINKFSTNADYQAFTEGGYVTPNICYVEETDGIVMKPYIDPNKVLFPAVIVPAVGNGNISNANIAQYFIDTYPNMIIDTKGKYTPITEDVTISGTRVCDGKVIGIASWGNNSEYISILFYTSDSLKNYHGLKVYIKADSIQPGTTMEWLYD